MKLYRYRASNDHTFSEIAESYIWLSKPPDLNDPFDCQLDVNHIIQQQDFKRTLEECGLDSDIVSEIVLGDYASDKYQTHVIRKTFDAVGIACFSIAPHNLPMWAHYAENHSGLCIEYEFPEDTIRNFFTPVVYTDTFPNNMMPHFPDSFDLTKEWEDFINVMLLTKSKEWENEKEWRLLLPDRGNSRLEIAQEFVTSIIVGYKMKHENKLLLRKALNSRKVIPNLLVTKKIPNTFHLTTVPTSWSDLGLN